MSEFAQVRARLSELNTALNSDSRRLFHGRGQSYEGLSYLSIDWFEPAILITLFEHIGSDREAQLVEAVRSSISMCEAIYIQKRDQPSPRFSLIWGEEITSLVAKRADLKFHLNLQQQNVGYFLDIEPARRWLQENSAHKRVLNLFAFTCSFSVVASRFGARAVLNMDLSSPSLSVGRKNYALNQLSTENIFFYANDIFKSWGRIKRYGPYDIVIVDPPSLQKGSFIASQDYAKVIRRLDTFTTSDAKVLLCLNSPEVSYSEFTREIQEHVEGFKIQKCLPANDDFPDAEPERALKMVVLEKDGCH